MPDEVRAATVRTVVFLAFTLTSLTYATLASYAHARKALSLSLLVSGIGVFGIVWCLAEIVIARQIAAQRRRGPGQDAPMRGGRPPRR
jgi:ABC-type enterochelin transport system permease subunit